MLRRLLARQALKLALGKDIGYCLRSLSQDSRLRRAREVDIIVRKDGIERRIEADWIKTLARRVL